MTPLNISKTRHIIAHSFSQWAALSALRSGSPIKSRDDIYPLIKLEEFAVLLDSNRPITSEEFGTWHAKISKSIVRTSDNVLSFGWAAKLVNVYLKSMVYLSKIGRPELVQHLHPPIDAGLWQGLKRTYKNDSTIWNKVHSKTKIKDISSYPEYLTIIGGLREIAYKEKCLLIEVEKFWQGTAHKRKGG